MCKREFCIYSPQGKTSLSERSYMYMYMYIILQLLQCPVMYMLCTCICHVNDTCTLADLNFFGRNTLSCTWGMPMISVSCNIN